MCSRGGAKSILASFLESWLSLIQNGPLRGPGEAAQCSSYSGSYKTQHASAQLPSTTFLSKHNYLRLVSTARLRQDNFI